MPRQLLAPRIDDDQRGAPLGGVLDEGGGDRVVLLRPRADNDDNVGFERGGERRGDGARADPLDQCCDRGGMTEARAVIDVVRAETRTYQFLK